MHSLSDFPVMVLSNSACMAGLIIHSMYAFHVRCRLNAHAWRITFASTRSVADHAGSALGSGRFGVVLEAELGGTSVVVKLPHYGKDFEENCDRLEDEVDVLRHLQPMHPRGAHTT